ncbi:DUF3667 domain-containing protein [Fulvivirga sp. RKSG066]|uniref:DUF3667 domain-containing protein n=1 Tax=Fulvivirga aurantia TaxID=2529383 RepID=UPI0012BD0FE3|nr:DUF3667 domain-containing protein [Fulvivirga aurantia]MTI20942.1 DUF3667 domain-containing protein [Fulvivirga aurantia]
MRISRKTNSCLNCGRTLDKIYNYCPNCGQGNHDDNVSFGALLGDFFSTYFAVDSKFGRTVLPFFIKPGYLTNRYVEGKRESYAHPIRLYLIISLFYFFTVTIATNEVMKEFDGDETKKGIISNSKSTKLIDVLPLMDEGLKKDLQKPLSGKERKLLQEKLEVNNSLDSLTSYLSDLRPKTQRELRLHLGDSIADVFKLAEVSEEEKKKEEEKRKNKSDQSILNRIDFDKISDLSDTDLTDKQVYDSLKLGELSYFDEMIAYQMIRVNRADNKQVVGYVVKNLPLMMFILIPIFALVLKLLYVRRNELYIKHLIHALHLHCFAYLIYGVLIITTTYLLKNDDISEPMLTIGFILVSTYAFISFLKVYKQHWFKTLIKFNIVGGIYMFAIMIFFMMELAISLLLF